MSMEPFRLDSREIFRYIIPGLIGFVIFLPYIELFFPNWKNYGSAEKLGFAVFLILFLGVTIEIIVDLYARRTICWCCQKSFFVKLFDIKEKEPFIEPSKRRSVIPEETLLKMEPEDRELIFRSTAVAHMLVGTGIVFFINIVINSLKISFFLIEHGFSVTLSMVPLSSVITLWVENDVFRSIISIPFSFLMIYFCIKLAINYGYHRYGYFKAFLKER